MNLSERLKEIADIIDSLPKAEDGSVIWDGCDLVCKASRYGDTPLAGYCCGFDGGMVKVRLIVDGTPCFDLVNVAMIPSTHRTRDEAEAAAKALGEESK